MNVDILILQELMNNRENIQKALSGLEKARRGNAIKLDRSMYDIKDWVEHHLATIENVLNLTVKLGEKP